MVGRLIGAWLACTNEERERGIRWYREAYLTAALLGDSYHLPLHKVAAIIAVLSPGLAWDQNVVSAHQICASYPGKIRGYGRNRRKALRILAGETPESVLRGLKVTAFYRLIRDGGNSTDVCIDGHAANMALGRGKLLIKDSDVTPGQVRLLQAEFQLAARVIGVQPCQLQAATWLAWRSSHGFKQGRLPY